MKLQPTRDLPIYSRANRPAVMPSEMRVGELDKPVTIDNLTQRIIDDSGYNPIFPRHALMVDIETLDTRPYSKILSIAGVVFDSLADRSSIVDANGNVIAPHFSIVLELIGQGHRTQDESTVEWWSKQSPEARAPIFGPGVAKVPYVEGIRSFWAWAKEQQADGAFACSPAFDYTILDTAGEDVLGYGNKFPIPFYNHTDVRSLRNFVFGKKKIDWGIKHEALGDCVRQIFEMQELYLWRKQKQG